MAHPYAPMGGSYDDRVVNIVVQEFLKAGWIVGTFNFRGAHGSKGRTSWSGKPELDDYISFAAFFMHYMSFIQPFPTSDIQDGSDVLTESSRLLDKDLAGPQGQASPVVILGGYSYGSLILRHLPPVPTILQNFANCLPGSSAHETILRAHKIADQSNLEWTNIAHNEARERHKRRGHENNPIVIMGGEETTPEKRRRSRDVRRSLDNHTGYKRRTPLRSISLRHHEGAQVLPPEQHKSTLVVPEIRYLLISPLAVPISMLLAPALGRKFWHKEEGYKEAFSKHTSLAIYGDQDAFSSVKKLRNWIALLKTEAGTHFSSVEIVGAGHFWVEHHVEEELRAALSKWECYIR